MAHLLPRAIARQLWTFVLFTWTDLKTTLVPVTAVAVAASPKWSFSLVLRTAIWTWLHILQFNLSNQYYGYIEDVKDKPWRPIPSGRMSFHAAKLFRRAICLLCLLMSFVDGGFEASLLLVVLFYMHNDMQLCKNGFVKLVLNGVGYWGYELGATSVMFEARPLPPPVRQALIFNGLTIFLTIMAQDFQDVNGDALSGRRTVPIAFPKGSRIYIFATLILWTIFLTTFQQYPLIPAWLANFLAVITAFSFYLRRDSASDGWSYVIYNWWLSVVHLYSVVSTKGSLGVPVQLRPVSPAL